MPEMNGFEVLEELRKDKEHRAIPVIFLTGIRSAEIEARCFESGAVDFVTKPFSTPVLLNRVRLHIDVHLLIKQHTEKLAKNHQNMIFILANLVENRDSGTGGHIERTSEYVKVIVAEMQKQKVYPEEVSDWDIETMGICAILHDIGKIGVSDTILNKPGRLTDDEFTLMKNHASNGAKIICSVIERNGEDEFLRNALLFAEYHHESWDGSGYPHGLKELEIPIQGRVMAIADVYDALISERPYKPAFSHEKAVDIIMKDSGKRFDPDIAKIFSSINEHFKSVQMTIKGK
jgi:putative two-component system response regulator